MTIEEAQELFGEMELSFAHYYKYFFTYEGVSPQGHKVSAGFGGDRDDIYTTTALPTMKVGDIEENWKCFSVHVDGKEVLNYYEARW